MKSRLKSDEAIANLISKLGDKFDFSQFVFTKAHDKSTVICKKCGNAFQQSYSALMQGRGCKYCKFKKLKKLFTKPKDDFLHELKEIHGDKFSVLGEYKGNKIPIHVRCNDCGYEFNPLPINIVNKKQGCPKCSNRLLKTHGQFMEELKEKQGDKFEAITQYVNADTPITLRCKECGFEITNKPYKFLQGQGCKRCKGVKITCADDYYKLANEKWNGKFKYTGDYVNEKSPITVICPKHGETKMNPMAHLRSLYGCKECAKEDVGLKRLNNLDNLISEFKNKYGNIYDYSKYDYKGKNIPSTVICKRCGNEFQIDFAHHLRGQGCPFCRMSHLENEISALLDNHGIKYIAHCSKELPFLEKKHVDFYLAEYNIAIECQGRQHFMPSDYYGGLAETFRIMQRDRQKYQELTDNGIEVLYYTTVDFDISKVPFYKDKILFKNRELLLKYIINHGKASD